MFARSPARFLAPLFLAGIVVAIILIVGGSGNSPTKTTPFSTAGPTTQTKAKGAKAKKPKKASKSYVVKSGDTVAQIALKTGVTSDRLLILNPDLDPNALQVGQKIKLRP
jgi:LysM repeat protein